MYNVHIGERFRMLGRVISILQPFASGMTKGVTMSEIGAAGSLPPRGSGVVHVGPELAPDIEEAVRRAGARVGPIEESDAVVWMSGNAAELLPRLTERVSWVQLGSAGVERWIDAGAIDQARVWTSAAGAYSASVAEHAFALLLAGVRGIPSAIDARSWAREELLGQVGTLRGSTVLVVGAGGIGRALIPMLTAVGAEVIAVNRRGAAVDGARITVPAAELADTWKLSDHVVLSAPATEATRHLMGAAQLSALKPTSWIVNVARGSLIDSDALIAAVRTHTIAGAALDVTDPEPLPANHAFWDEPRIVVTQHVANPPVLLRRALAEFVETNVRRYLAGQELRGRIDLAEGY